MRQKELDEKKKEVLPKEFELYRDCLIFDGERFDQLEREFQEEVCIGDVQIDADEKEILKLNPNFAVLKYLDEELQERDIELGQAKVRYELRKRKEEEALKDYVIGAERKRKLHKADKENSKNQYNKERKSRADEKENKEIEDAVNRMIYDPEKRLFNYANRRATDLKENNKVTLPKPGSPKEEAELEMMRKIILDEFNKYKRTVEQESKNKEREKSEKKKNRKKDIEDKDTEKEKENRNQEWLNLTPS